MAWGDWEGLNERQVNALWRQIQQSRHFWRDLPPCFTDADRAALARLGERVQLMYLTNRLGREAEEQTRDWLWEQNLPWGPIQLTRNKPGDLLLIPELLGALEDSPHNLSSMAENGSPFFVMRRLYNAHLPLRGVDSVEEFAQIMELRVIAG